jgi:hypothetical protein
MPSIQKRVIMHCYLTLCLAFPLACTRPPSPTAATAPPPPTTAPVSTSQPTARAADRLDVLEAVFRHQFDKNASAGQRKVDYFFLALDADTDPPAELMKRFENETPKVLPASQATASKASGVKHKTQGGRGLIFRVTDIAFLGADTAEVSGGYYEAGLSASGNTYIVQRSNGKWKVTKDQMHWIA